MFEQLQPTIGYVGEQAVESADQLDAQRIALADGPGHRALRRAAHGSGRDRAAANDTINPANDWADPAGRPIARACYSGAGFPAERAPPRDGRAAATAPRHSGAAARTG